MLRKIKSMTFREFRLKVIYKIGPLKKSAISRFKKYISSERNRRKFNEAYNNYSFGEKNAIQNLYAKIFRNGHDKFEPGVWEIKFGNSLVKLPLREESIWLDWDSAVSILGHDVSIKKTYEALLNSEKRPRVFFDIGANYGTHSLLLLSQNVNVVSFEPNPSCRAEFESACRLNGFAGKAENSALGDQTGTASLYFPEDNTWLGTILPREKDVLEKDHKLKEIQINISTLDLYTGANGLYPDLIKIDTEGNEYSVLRGGAETIKKAQPVIIFETNARSERNSLASFFEHVDYLICDLPLEPGKPPVKKSLDSFLDSPNNNFLAVHSSFVSTWK